MRHSLLAAAIATATMGVSAAAQAAEENAPAPQATEQAAPPPANLDLGPDIGPDRGPDERPLPPHMRRMPGPDVLGWRRSFRRPKSISASRRNSSVHGAPIPRR